MIETRFVYWSKTNQCYMIERKNEESHEPSFITEKFSFRNGWGFEYCLDARVAIVVMAQDGWNYCGLMDEKTEEGFHHMVFQKVIEK